MTLDFKQIFQHNLAFLRKRARLSQEELSNKIDIKRSSIASYEKGISEPNLSKLSTIAQFFNVSVDKLVSVKFDETNMPIIKAVTDNKLDISDSEDQIQYYKEKTLRIEKILNSFITIYEYKKTQIASDYEQMRLLTDIDNFIDLLKYVINFNKKTLNLA